MTEKKRAFERQALVRLAPEVRIGCGCLTRKGRSGPE